ncbi:MAG: hypothetical protein M3P47_05970 [Pseudomonadota bacterium]|nr:hypothetical protein [Pseudomonadota bacterium]
MGTYIYLRALTADITIALGSRTVVASQGMIISTATYTEFYVDPNEGTTALSHIAGSAATLQILYG